MDKLSDFQKRRLAKLQKRLTVHQRAQDQYLREGARLACVSDKLMGDFRQFWFHVQKVMK